MCGIAGFINFSNQSTTAEILSEMIQSINHRGPDDIGIWHEENLALGHARLSIHDLTSAGQQPMHSYTGRWVVVFNGEIYNYQAIKKELLSCEQITFQSHSDTEVLINAIDHWGVNETLKKCVGMFAFAAWDKKEKKLYVARDRFGEKPLYYGQNNNVFAFASELKALKPLKKVGWKFDVDRDVLASYMRYGYVPTPYSIYKDIYKCEPGMVITLSENKIIDKHYYWQPESVFNRPKFSGNYQEAVDVLDHRLKDTLKIQMASDVPLGAFLSGGVDSSTIVALMQSMSTKKIQTFSIGFHDQSFNEAHHAKAVANHIGTNHTELYVTERDALNVIPKLPHIYDEPFADSSQIPTFLVSELAKSKVTVSLSGDAGDELFGGYNRHLLANTVKHKIMNRLLIRLALIYCPHKILKLMGLRSNKYRLLAEKLLKLQCVISNSKQSEVSIYQNLCSQIYQPESLVLNSQEKSLYTGNELSDLSLSYQEWMMFADAKTYMMDDILTKVDRAAMAVSLETRVPFLDHRLFEFAWSLPLSYKIGQGVGKRILRDVLYKYVPRELIDRPKMGFGVPIGNWLRADLKEWAFELLNPAKISAQGFLKSDVVYKYWSEHQSGKRNWQSPLWHILMFQSWLEQEGK